MFSTSELIGEPLENSEEEDIGDKNTSEHQIWTTIIPRAEHMHAEDI